MKRNIKRLIIVVLIFVLACYLWGCEELEKSIDAMRAELKHDITTAENDMAKDELHIEEIYETVPAEATIAPEKMKVELYFADAKGEKLVKTTREIEKSEGMARATITALLQGPTESGQISPIPSGTKLRDIHIKNQVCIIDLSEEFNDAGKGLADESLAIQAIVQTLCQFSTVDAVEFRVEGEPLEELNETLIDAQVFCDMSVL